MARPPHRLASAGRCFPFPTSACRGASASFSSAPSGSLRRSSHSWSSAPALLRSSSAPSAAPWLRSSSSSISNCSSSRGGSSSIASALRRNWHSSVSPRLGGTANSGAVGSVADLRHQEHQEQERTEKDEADERAEEAAEMGREDQHHTPPPPKPSAAGGGSGGSGSGGAGTRRTSKKRSAAAAAATRRDDADPEEARQQEEEEEVRRLQQLRLERAEMGRGHGEDDRPRAREERKKCLAYCTADAYVLHKLYRALRADDVIAAEWKISYIRRDRKYIRLRCLDDSEIYIFPFGSFVCWDVDDADFIRVRQLIRACERGERTELYEDFDFAYGRDTAVDPEDDELILKEDDSTAKWPVSFALAQSIKLDYFEKEVKDTFQEMQALSHYLARNGSIPLGPKKIVQEMGKIMELLVNVNLGETDFVSDIPDEFWEDSESANTWKIFNSHLGVKNRAKVLDSQLKMFNDFYSMLSSEVHVKKSTRLEWAIIFLISIEVVFGVADHSDWIASFIP